MKDFWIKMIVAQFIPMFKRKANYNLRPFSFCISVLVLPLPMWHLIITTSQ